MHAPPTRSSRRCTRCGTPLKSWSAASVCWSCMINADVSFEHASDQRANSDIELAKPTTDAITSDRSNVDLNTPEIGRRFGDYLLEHPIAHGGMGVVYRARQISLGRTVAVKLLLLGRYSSADSIARFRREAQAAAALRHPHIVAIHEVGEHDGQCFFSMEFVPGKNLAEVFRSGPLPAERAAQYARTIAEALHYAHTQGVLHRDLKPSNVLLDEQGELRITDFGLAKRFAGPLSSTGSGKNAVFRTSGDPDLTLTGQLLGTPNYLSPEAAAGRSADVGPASDVYAIGALLYEALTSHPPFLSPSLHETLLRIRDTEPVPPRTLNPSVPRDLETVALKCLDKSPSRRYASAQALADDLGRWLRHEPIEARPVGTAERVWKWAKREPKFAGLIATTIIAVAAFIAAQTAFSIRLARAHRDTKEVNVRLSQNLRDLEWQQAEDLQRAGKTSAALTLFSRFLRDNPHDETAASRILSMLSWRSFGLPVTQPLAHTGRVVQAELSSDGSRVFTASSDGTARIWDTATSRELLRVEVGAPLFGGAFLDQGRRFVTLHAKGCQVWDATIAAKTAGSAPESSPSQPSHPDRLLATFARKSSSPDRWALRRDRAAFAFDDDGYIRAFDAGSLQPLGPALPLAGRLWTAEFSPQNDVLLTSSYIDNNTREVSLWDIASGKRRLGPLHGKLSSVTFTPDGQRVVLASTEGVLSVLDVATGVELRRRGSIGSDLVQLQVTPDGRRIVTARWNGTVQVLDSETLELIGREFGGEGGEARIELSPTSQHVVIGVREGLLRLWDLESGKMVSESLGHDGPILAMHFSADGTHVATASGDATARIWDVRMRTPPVQAIQLGADARAVEFSRDGRRFLTVSSRVAQLWDAATLERIGAAMPHEEIFTTRFSPDGRLLFTSSFLGTVRIWRAETGDAVGAPLVHPAEVWHCEFSTDGGLLVTTARDGLARVWNTATGELEFAPLSHPEEVHVVSISADQERIVTGCVDGVARLWSLRTGEPLGQPMHHRGLVFNVRFSPDGTRLVTAGADAIAQIWDGVTGAPLGQPMRHDRAVLSINFSPDGEKLLTASEDGAARVWNASTGDPISRWMRQRNRIWTARFSPDGRRVATASDDGTVRLWDAQSGYPVSEPLQHPAEAQRVSFHSDGTRLATGSKDGTVHLWQIWPTPLPVPEWFLELADAVAGRRHEAQGDVIHASEATLRKLRTMLANDAANDFYTRWARWFLHDRMTAQPPAFVP